MGQGSLVGVRRRKINKPHKVKRKNDADLVRQPGWGCFLAWVGEYPKGCPSPLTTGHRPSCLSSLRARQLRQLFHVSVPSPTGKKPEKGCRPGILGPAVPRELGGSASLCIRELTRRPTQGRPEVGPRSLGELPALLQKGLEVGPA